LEYSPCKRHELPLGAAKAAVRRPFHRKSNGIVRGLAGQFKVLPLLAAVGDESWLFGGGYAFWGRQPGAIEGEKLAFVVRNVVSSFMSWFSLFSITCDAFRSAASVE
jgi:hypothetical protein